LYIIIIIIVNIYIYIYIATTSNPIISNPSLLDVQDTIKQETPNFLTQNSDLLLQGNKNNNNIIKNIITKFYSIHIHTLYIFIFF